MSDELVELLWVLEATFALEPELQQMLDSAISGPCFNIAELPYPEPQQRKAPVEKSATGELLKIMSVGDDESSDVY